MRRLYIIGAIGIAFALIILYAYSSYWIYYQENESIPSELLPSSAVSQQLDEASCLETGGRWAGDEMGRGRIVGCVLQTGDAGKSCDDSTQCEGPCLAISNKNGVWTGECHDENQYRGCNVLATFHGDQGNYCTD